MDKKIQRSPLKKYFKAAVFATSALGLSAVAYSFSQSSAQGRSHSLNTTSVTISAVAQGEFVDAISLRGQVVPKTTIYLDSMAGGRVEQRLVEQGEYVEKGQPLVQLSNTNLQLDVMSREAQVTEQLNFLRNTQMNMATSQLNLRRDLLEIELQISHLERNIKQTKPLVESGSIAQDRLDELTSDLAYYLARKELTLTRQKQENSIREVQIKQLEDSAEMLDINLKFARKNLENLLVRAPVSGYLSELKAEIGESKAQGARLGQIDIPNEYKLAINLDEFYLNQIQTGSVVIVKLDKQSVEAQITKVDSRVNDSEFQIEVDLPTGIQGVKRGQSLDVNVMLGGNKANALLLPRGAFFTSSGGNWAYVVNPAGDSATRRNIRLGKKNQDYFEVLSGLSLGEQVITSSYGNFDNAQQLQLN